MIRPANISDTEALFQLLNQCAQALAEQGMRHWLGVYSLEAILNNLNIKKVLVLEQDHTIVGCIALSNVAADYYQRCWPQADKADIYISQFAIAPDKQKQGLGKQLINYCLRDLPAHHTVQLDAIAHYPALLDFYHRLGFRIIATGIGLGDKRHLFTLTV